MFIYFSENKCAYHKGQLAPFFIAFIIIIIIAALVTINIGKVAKTKTYSANSADAGVLAAASTMASAFNYIAVSNSYMIVNYQYFISLATVSFVIGYVFMTDAMSETSTALTALGVACGCLSCCPPEEFCDTCPCFDTACEEAEVALAAAIKALEGFMQTMVSLSVQVTGYWMAQFFFYKMIREMADKYYHNALDRGYSFAFSNSGIFSKLKGCGLTDTSLCDDCQEACERDCKRECGDNNSCLDRCSREELNCLINNCKSQRAEYQFWIRDNTKDVPNGTISTYDWEDGQGREHSVASQVIIDPINDYDIRHTMLPFPAEIALFDLAIYYASTAVDILAGAKSQACSLGGVCAAEGEVATAKAPEIKALVTSAVAQAGLAVNGVFSSHNSNDVAPYLITWIDDVVHNRLVDVYQTQRHQGADLGVWSTEYPLTTSSSRASFEGNGKIYMPDPHHDASIILTDFLNSHLLIELDEPIKDVEGAVRESLPNSNLEEEEEEEE